MKKTKGEKVTPFGQSLPVWTIKGVPPPPGGIRGKEPSDHITWWGVCFMETGIAWCSVFFWPRELSIVTIHEERKDSTGIQKFMTLSWLIFFLFFQPQCLIYKQKLEAKLITVNYFSSGHCRDLEFVSTLPRVSNSGILFLSNLCNLFLPGI